MRHEFRSLGRAREAVEPLSDDEAWVYAQELRGKKVYGRSRAESEANEAREQLEWLAGISPRHHRELLALQVAEEEAARNLENPGGERSNDPPFDEAWDSSKHPRTGTSPNAGWFASTSGGGGGGGPLPDSRTRVSPHSSSTPPKSRPSMAQVPQFQSAMPLAASGSHDEVAQMTADKAPGFVGAATKRNQSGGDDAMLLAAAPRSVQLTVDFANDVGKVLAKFGLKSLDDLKNAPNSAQAKAALDNALASYVRQLIDNGESADTIRDFLNGSPSARKIAGVPDSLRGGALEFKKVGKRYTITLKPAGNVGIKHDHFDAGIGFTLTITW